ncbi:MAG: CGNR zinc finger domain-containing protein [Pseudonocardia sp.]
MQFNTYGGAAARLGAALANLGPDAETAQVMVVMREFWTGPAEPDEAEAAELVEWGARLRAVFTAGSDTAKVAVLNELLADVAARPFLSTHDGQPPHLHYTADSGRLSARVRAQTAAGLAVLLADSGARRLGACAAPGCATVFVDTSRAGRRTYCTPTCATRVNVAAHRARRVRG